MGRVILQVDVVEILTLAWDHPLVTGALVLMFTPPFFPVIVFFSPLLISTALCAVALISVGHQIEATRELEIAGWNARVVEGDHLAARLANARRRRGPGEERWQDLVQGFEPGSDWKPENSLMSDIKEEGLKTDFRSDEGGIEFMEEDFFDRQIRAFREYERSFSFRTGVVTGIPANPDAFALGGIPSTMEMVPFPKADASMFPFPKAEAPMLPFPKAEASMAPVRKTDAIVSEKQIPPIFLYNLRTGGTGNRRRPYGAGELSSTQETVTDSGQGQTDLAFGSFDMSGIIDAELARGDYQQQPPPRSMFETFSKTPEKHQVSHAAELMSNVAEKVYKSLHSPIKPTRSLEKNDFQFSSTSGGVGIQNDRVKGFNLPSPVASRGGVATKPSDRSYNARLRVGNAVIYNASSESVSTAALERHGSGSAPRKHSNRERRSATTPTRQKRRHLSEEKSSKHPFRLEVRPSDDRKQTTRSPTDN